MKHTLLFIIAVLASPLAALHAAPPLFERTEVFSSGMNGINRWLGGVHLLGEDARWRWDAGLKTLMRYW